jgi:hypothetical protein
VLHEDIEQADQHGDTIASRSATAELDVLLRQLSAAAAWAVGTGGWVMRWSGLRKTVSARIRALRTRLARP